MIGARRPQPPRHRGRRALAAAAAAFVCTATLAGCSRSTAKTPTSTKASTTTTTAALVGTLTPTESVIAGQCLDALPDEAQQTYAVMVIPCEDPHTYEVYAQTKIDIGSPTPPGTPYPGGLTVSNAAEAQCLSAFEQFMGLSWEESNYDVQAWWPSAESWTAKKDRTVLCGVYRVTGGTTKGSVRGSKQ